MKLNMTKPNDNFTETTIEIAGLKRGRGGNQRVSPFVIPRKQSLTKKASVKKQKLFLIHL